jgi:hypothetical protein
MIARRLALVVFLTLLAVSLVAEAQPGGTVRTIGLLGSQPFEEGLRELGWVERNTVRFERRASRDYRDLARLATELVRVPVDVIYAARLLPSVPR